MLSLCVRTHDGTSYASSPQSTNRAATDKPYVLATPESIKLRFHRVSRTGGGPQRWECELAPDASLRGAPCSDGLTKCRFRAYDGQTGHNPITSGFSTIRNPTRSRAGDGQTGISESKLHQQDFTSLSIYGDRLPVGNTLRSAAGAHHRRDTVLARYDAAMRKRAT